MNKKELKVPWAVKRLKAGDVIEFNARWTMNLSLEKMRDKCIPMSDTVAYVQLGGPSGSVLVETISKTMLYFPNEEIEVQLVKEIRDTANPHVFQHGETYGHVSID